MAAIKVRNSLRGWSKLTPEITLFPLTEFFKLSSDVIFVLIYKINWLIKLFGIFNF